MMKNLPILSFLNNIKRNTMKPYTAVVKMLASELYAMHEEECVDPCLDSQYSLIAYIYNKYEARVKERVYFEFLKLKESL